jgi:hypothetical protein
MHFTRTVQIRENRRHVLLEPCRGSVRLFPKELRSLYGRHREIA